MLHELTELQNSVMDLKGKNVLKACPGSGKTYVIAHKVAKDYSNWREKNKGMAVLSFTNVAKDELAIKIRELTHLKELPYPHYVGTLDSFISQFIFLPYGNLILKNEQRPSLLENDFAIRFSKFFWKKECYSNCCKPDEFIMGMDRKVYYLNKKAKSCPILKNKPCIKFKNSVYTKGYINYQESLMIAIEILRKYPEILSLIIKRFPNVIVDEAQDTSNLQMELLNLLFDNGVKTSILIGDPDQAIYEWRDADPTVFLNLYKMDTWNSIELNENFRCSQHICNATHIFSSLTHPSISIGKSKDCSLKPIVMKYENENSLIKKFETICMENEISITPKNVAVLVRGRSSINGNNYSSISNLWQTPETEMLAKATYYKGECDTVKTKSFCEKFIYYIVFDNNANSIDECIINKKYSTKEWNSLIFDLATILPDSSVSLKEWKYALNDILEKYLVKNKIDCISKANIKTKTRVVDKKISDFMDQPIKKFFVESEKDRFLITTIHAVKGCTFDAVMLIIKSRGKLTPKMINEFDTATEEIRTFYVAATRARKLFVVAFPETTKKKTLVRFPEDKWTYV